jgi:hypothetical protein
VQLPRFLHYSKLRLQAFLEQVANLSESEFPYRDSRVALDLVELAFKRRLSRLDRLHAQSDPGVVKQECRLALEDLFTYLPLLGFILRSTNVRNAFEAFAPIRRLARRLLSPSTSHAPPPEIKLLLSSEWDYSPFVYDAILALPNFLMIGLPAPESSNPLLLPLAGHELGHALWRSNSLGDELQATVNTAVLVALKARWEEYRKLFPDASSPDDLETSAPATENWLPASDWAVTQAEETFCDFAGLLLFGPSFLDAFAYLLSPAFGRRALTYPPLRERARNLVWAAAEREIVTPDSYPDLFDPEDAPTLSRRDKFRLSLADEALQRVRSTLLERASDFVARAGLILPSPEEIETIFRKLKGKVPAERAASLIAILNAAWKAFHEKDLWPELPTSSPQRDSLLKELTLKSLEILEFEYLTRPLP